MERKPVMTKAAARYRPGTADRHCGNCVMFRPEGTGWAGLCDLVIGVIDPHRVCDHWEKRPE